jgi:hypothetical protein
MSERVHIVLGRAEKERYRRWAEREGKTLSEWLREAAREKLAASSAGRALDTREALESFFEGCDAGERGGEPDWAEHRRVIEESIRSGSGSVSS